MTTTMVRVISMASASQRRAQFAAHAQGVVVPWEFFDALTGPRLPLVHAPESALVRTGRALRPGELGCYASHYAVWEDFLASTAEQLLVFEDDVLVDWVAVTQLVSQDFAAMEVHVLKLFATFPLKFRTVRHKFYSDHSHLVRVQGYCYGTQAYLLTRQAATALVEACAVLDMPVDWAMSRYWAYDYANYAVVPFPVIERLVPSSIGHPPAGGAGQGRVGRSRRLAWRLRDRARRLLVDWHARWRGPKLKFEAIGERTGLKH